MLQGVIELTAYAWLGLLPLAVTELTSSNTAEHTMLSLDLGVYLLFNTMWMFCFIISCFKEALDTVALWLDILS